MNQEITDIFERFKNQVGKADTDLPFTLELLNTAIKTFENHPGDKIQSTSIFRVYDIDTSTNIGDLKVNIQEPRHVRVKDISQIKSWLLSLTIIEMYSALELFLLEIIQLSYFPEIDPPRKNKKSLQQLKTKMKETLKTNQIRVDTSNNIYVLDFLCFKCQKLEQLLQLKVTRAYNKSNTWKNYFVFIALVRHILSHNGGIINQEMKNNLKSHGKEILPHFFSIKRIDSEFEALIYNEDRHHEFINILVDFALNTMKIVLNEKDFEFLGLK